MGRQGGAGAVAPLLGIGLLSGLATGGFVLVALAALDLQGPFHRGEADALMPPATVTSWALGEGNGGGKAPSAPISPMVDGGVPALAAMPSSTETVSPPPAAATAVPVTPADLPAPADPAPPADLRLDDLRLDDVGALNAAGVPASDKDDAERAGGSLPAPGPHAEDGDDTADGSAVDGTDSVTDSDSHYDSDSDGDSAAPRPQVHGPSATEPYETGPSATGTSRTGPSATETSAGSRPPSAPASALDPRLEMLPVGLVGDVPGAVRTGLRHLLDAAGVPAPADVTADLPADVTTDVTADVTGDLAGDRSGGLAADPSGDPTATPAGDAAQSLAHAPRTDATPR